jgi:hypothetical protein
LRNKVLEEHFGDEKEKVRKARISKKLYYFLDVVRDLVLKFYNEIKKKSQVYREIFEHILSKNAATYLRQDCLQIFFEAVNKKDNSTI